jgi:hypothetical protein
MEQTTGIAGRLSTMAFDGGVVAMVKGEWPPPGYPLVDGEYRLTDTWSIHLPELFARRIENGSLVLWRPGLTVWLVAWGNDTSETQASRLAGIKQSASPDRDAEQESKGGGITRYSYRLRDESDERPVESVYGFVIDDGGHLQLAVYFDDPTEEGLGRQLVDSVTRHAEPGAAPDPSA